MYSRHFVRSHPHTFISSGRRRAGETLRSRGGQRGQAECANREDRARRCGLATVRRARWRRSGAALRLHMRCTRGRRARPPGTGSGVRPDPSGGSSRRPHRGADQVQGDAGRVHRPESGSRRPVTGSWCSRKRAMNRPTRYHLTRGQHLRTALPRHHVGRVARRRASAP